VGIEQRARTYSIEATILLYPTTRATDGARQRAFEGYSGGAREWGSTCYRLPAVIVMQAAENRVSDDRSRILLQLPCAW